MSHFLASALPLEETHGVRGGTSLSEQVSSTVQRVRERVLSKSAVKRVPPSSCRQLVPSVRT